MALRQASRSETGHSNGVNASSTATEVAVYNPGSYIFGYYCDDKRWYAGKIRYYDKIRKEYGIKWCEDKSETTLSPREIRLPGDLLRKGLPVHLISDRQQKFYDDAEIEDVGDQNLQYLCKLMPSGKTVWKNVKDIMVKNSKLKEFKNKDFHREKADGPSASHSERHSGTSKRSHTDLPTIENTDSHQKRLCLADSSCQPPAVQPTGQLLTGCVFIVTQANRIPSWEKRGELIDRIVAMGGIVLENVQDFLQATGKRLLIAPEFLRTVKYIQCLAAGIPCVSETWIDTIYCSNRYMEFDPHYMLPAGIARPGGHLVQWQSCPLPFEGMRIGLYGDQWFVEMYTNTLSFSQSGGVVVVLDDSSLVNGMEFCSVILIDENTETEEAKLRKVLEAAKETSIAVLGSEWLVQCVIQKRVVPFHPFVFSD